jgi:hypothetical protein
MSDSPITRKPAKLLLTEEEVPKLDYVPSYLSSSTLPETPEAEKAEPKDGVDDIEDRRSQVVKLRLRGHTFDEISTKLGVSTVTVRRDYAKYKEESKQTVVDFDKEDFIAMQISGLEDVIQLAQKEFDSIPRGAPQRLKCLDVIRNTRNDIAKLMSDAGLIEKIEKHQHIITQEVIHGWSPELKEAAAHAYLQASLRTQLPPPEPPELDIIDVEVVETPKEE